MGHGEPIHGRPLGAQGLGERLVRSPPGWSRCCSLIGRRGMRVRQNQILQGKTLAICSHPPSLPVSFSSPTPYPRRHLPAPAPAPPQRPRRRRRQQQVPRADAFSYNPWSSSSPPLLPPLPPALSRGGSCLEKNWPQPRGTVKDPGLRSPVSVRSHGGEWPLRGGEGQHGAMANGVRV
jgi:hypothetical protein